MTIFNKLFGTGSTRLTKIYSDINKTKQTNNQNTRDNTGYFARIADHDLSTIKSKYTNKNDQINKPITQGSPNNLAILVPSDIANKPQATMISQLKNDLKFTISENPKENRKTLNNLFDNPNVAKYLKKCGIKPMKNGSIYSITNDMSAKGGGIAREKLLAIQDMLDKEAIATINRDGITSNTDEIELVDTKEATARKQQQQYNLSSSAKRNKT